MAESETRPDQGPVLGGAVQQAKAKSLFHVRRVTGSQADRQAGSQAAVLVGQEGRVYTVAVKDTSEVK